MLFHLMTDTEIVNEICMRIRNARQSLNLSQRDLARKAKIGIATVKRIEAGEAVNINTLISVLRALELLYQLEFLLNEYRTLNTTRRHRPREKTGADSNKADEVMNKQAFNEVYHDTMSHMVTWFNQNKNSNETPE
ncbi:helix-turn-helix domain-containing protein [Escherichia coli]|uniref:helix-turn-helix domain-containing protein n=1 Tax=Escherichia coli TaxID=562 RepID=UPI0039DF56AC